MIKIKLQQSEKQIWRYLYSLSREAEHAFIKGKKIRAQTRPYQSLLLYILAKQYDGGTILDLGTYHGHSAFLFAEAAPKAKIITVDINPDHTKKAKDNLKRFNNIFFKTACSWDLAKDWELPLDMIFVDANHSLVKKDLIWFEHLKIGGLLLFHDYTEKGSPKVVKAVDWLAQSLGKEPEILIIDGKGIGMAGIYKNGM